MKTMPSSGSVDLELLEKLRAVWISWVRWAYLGGVSAGAGWISERKDRWR
jgi:hypothetical protein